MDTRIYWYNKVTEEYNLRATPATDEEMVQYIPQSVAAQGLYVCHRKMGKSILEAAARTLTAAVGEEWVETEETNKDTGGYR